jgi:hypothetical protein
MLLAQLPLGPGEIELKVRNTYDIVLDKSFASTPFIYVFYETRGAGKIEAKVRYGLLSSYAFFVFPRPLNGAKKSIHLV